MWQAYFSLFKLADSLFDLTRVYKKFMTNTGLSTTRLSEANKNENEMKLCAICGNQPTMVHCAKNYSDSDACKHVYCYFCLSRAINESSSHGYVCRICSRIIYDCEMFINNKNL